MNRSVIVDILGPKNVDFFDNALEKISQDIDSRNIDIEKVYWLVRIATIASKLVS